MKIATARMPIMMQISLTSSLIVSGVVVGPNESKTGPRKKKKQGRMAPVRAAKSQPRYSLHFSPALAVVSNLLKGTEAPNL